MTTTPYPTTIAGLEALARHPDREIREGALYDLAELRAERQRAERTAKLAPQPLVKQAPMSDDDWKLDKICPDDGSHAALLRRALLLIFNRRSVPAGGGFEMERREDTAIASLLDGNWTEQDRATINAGIADLDADREPLLETVVDEYEPDMPEAELRAWAERVSEAGQAAYYLERAERQDRQEWRYRVHQRAEQDHRRYHPGERLRWGLKAA